MNIKIMFMKMKKLKIMSRLTKKIQKRKEKENRKKKRSSNKFKNQIQKDNRIISFISAEIGEFQKPKNNLLIHITLNTKQWSKLKKF